MKLPKRMLVGTLFEVYQETIQDSTENFYAI